MSGNTFGELFRVTTFGESHGPGLGVIIDGVPAGVKIDEALIQRDLDRRRPGQSKVSTMRKEPDRVEILSGVFEGVSTGTSLAMVIRNTDQRSQDSAGLRSCSAPATPTSVSSKSTEYAIIAAAVVPRGAKPRCGSRRERLRRWCSRRWEFRCGPVR